MPSDRPTPPSTAPDLDAIRTRLASLTKREQEWRDVSRAGIVRTTSRERFEQARRDLFDHAESDLASLLSALDEERRQRDEAFGAWNTKCAENAALAAALTEEQQAHAETRTKLARSLLSRVLVDDHQVCDEQTAAAQRKLEAAVKAHISITAAYRTGGRTPEKALDTMGEIRKELGL